MTKQLLIELYHRYQYLVPYQYCPIHRPTHDIVRRDVIRGGKRRSAVARENPEGEIESARQANYLKRPIHALGRASLSPKHAPIKLRRARGEPYFFSDQ